MAEIYYRFRDQFQFAYLRIREFIWPDPDFIFDDTEKEAVEVWPIITIKDIAEAVLVFDHFEAKSLTQEYLEHRNINLSSVDTFESSDPRLLPLAASLLELFAQRRGEQAPDWTKDVGSIHEPLYLWPLSPEETFTKRLCDSQSPEPLRKRGFLAPPQFLTYL